MTETSTASGDSTLQDTAAKVAGEAQHAGAGVAGAAQEGASRVASEAAGQTRRLLATARDELRERAGEQQQRAAEGLRAVGRQLHEMADGASDQGAVAELVGQAGGRVDAVAGFLKERDPGSLLEEVTDFARRKPGVFLAVALGAGLVTGRLVKSLTAGDPAPASAATSSPDSPPSAFAPSASPVDASDGTA